MKRRGRGREITIQWSRQPRQLTFLRACGLAYPFEGGGPQPPAAEVIGYGGAAGGGKTDALLMAGIIACLTWPGVGVAYFRRQYPQLTGLGGAIPRSRELLTGWCRYNGDDRRWTFPNGSMLQFCHCNEESDVYNYQSQQFDVVLIDEATQFTRFQYRYLRSRNRATRDGVTPFMALATNPGNVGHIWFRTEFVDIGPPETPKEVEVESGKFECHTFIPAKLADNQVLEQRDPGYRKRLENLPIDERRMLLEGDWDVFAGQYYSVWRREIHVIKPFSIPGNWRHFRSLDYGLDMTACYWWAVAPDGHEYIYRELYEPNLSLSQAAARVLELSPLGEDVRYTVASPDLWNRRQDTGFSGYEIMTRAGLRGLVKADDRRIPGWRALREHLEPYEETVERIVDGQVVQEKRTVAKLRVFETCTNLIRTLPALVHDEHDPEDVSDKCEDHGPEAIRYGVMSRPRAQVERPKDVYEPVNRWTGR